jgi:hypothetical protein
VQGDYQALDAAIAADPSLASLRGGPLVAALNAAVSVPLPSRRVAREEIERVALDRGKLAAIQAAAASGNAHALQAAYLVLQSRIPTVNLDAPPFESAVQGLVSDGLLDDADVTAIQALATRQSTVSQEIEGWGLSVTIDDLAHIGRGN